MTETSTHEILNRLLAIVGHSFVTYMTYAKPWAPATDRRALGSLDQIVAEQRSMAERISTVVLESGGHPNRGEYPMEFTDAHDLSLEYLLRKAVVYQQADVTSIERCVTALRDAPTASALAEEALAMAKRHLALLEELMPRRSGFPA
jgi:hypothetical protein